MKPVFRLPILLLSIPLLLSTSCSDEAQLAEQCETQSSCETTTETKTNWASAGGIGAGVVVLGALAGGGGGSGGGSSSSSSTETTNTSTTNDPPNTNTSNNTENTGDTTTTAFTMKQTTEFCEDVCDGLVAYYPFFGNANDTSGNNKNGQIFGNPTFVEDRDRFSNRSILFDGDDYILIEGFDHLNLKKESLSFRFIIDHRHEEIFHEFGGHCLFYGLGFGANFAKEKHDFYPHITASPVINEKYSSGCYFNLENHMNYQDIFLIFDRTIRSTKIYLNGDLVCETPIIDEYFSVPNGRLLVGVEPIDSWSGYFKGKLDELRIYNRALSESEIQQIIGQ